MPPICDGTIVTCRQCSANDNRQADGGCAGTTPVCETNEESPKFGDCVQCTANGGCSGQTPVCIAEGTMADSCRGCASDEECTAIAASQVCLATGACGAMPSSSCASTSGQGTLVLVALVAALLVRRARKVFFSL